jgi:hypothetical protein
MNFKGTEYDVDDCIQLAQDRGHWWVLVNTVLNLWVS